MNLTIINNSAVDYTVTHRFVQGHLGVHAWIWSFLNWILVCLISHFEILMNLRFLKGVVARSLVNTFMHGNTTSNTNQTWRLGINLTIIWEIHVHWADRVLYLVRVIILRIYSMVSYEWIMREVLGRGRERKGEEGRGRERKGEEGRGRERKGEEGRGREWKTMNLTWERGEREFACPSIKFKVSMWLKHKYFSIENCVAGPWSVNIRNGWNGEDHWSTPSV